MGLNGDGYQRSTSMDDGSGQVNNRLYTLAPLFVIIQSDWSVMLHLHLEQLTGAFVMCIVFSLTLQQPTVKNSSLG